MSRLGLFEAYGVELEYMIVDRASLRVRPIAERLLVDDGAVVSEVEHGPISWSNELVSHVVELKTTTPTPTLAGLEAIFHENVRNANERLREDDCALLGSGAHPFFDPSTETVIWPHEYNQVYLAYDRIFGCRGHGWSNLQSAHLNLPFADDDEFGRLHAAVRLVLPLIPALAASSPFLDGGATGRRDARLHVYRHNQDRIPELVGKVIPEAVFSEEEYEERIYRPILRALAPHDPDRVLKKHFANSRGAIARFDRGSIEVRVVDLQECATADVAVLALITETVRALVEERWCSYADQRAWDEAELAVVFDGCVESGEAHHIANGRYLDAFGLTDPAGTGSPVTAGRLWRHLLEELGDDLTEPHAAALDHIVAAGTLSTRLLRSAGREPGQGALRQLYARLVECAAEDRQLGRGGSAWSRPARR